MERVEVDKMDKSGCLFLGLTQRRFLGEKLVRFASIINERRCFGRGGAGAVMGAKNLKAIMVGGTKSVKLFDEEKFDTLVRDIQKRFRESPFVEFFGKYGTAGSLSNVNFRGIFPTRNFQSGVFEGTSKIDGLTRQVYATKHVTCYGCPVACTVKSVATKEPYAGIETEGPEYENMWAFGALCGNDNYQAIIAGEELCDRYGIDVMSTGNCIAFAMECFEKGLINVKDTDGIDLRFGNHEAMIDMARKIALREGFGDLLAEGTLRASQKIGKASQKFAMQVKGMEMGGYDPRGAMGQGLSYATGSRGGDHQKGLIMPEVFGFPPPRVDRFGVEGKGQLVKSIQDEINKTRLTKRCRNPLL